MDQLAQAIQIDQRTDVLILVSLDSLAAVAGFGAEERSGESVELAGQVAAVAPDLLHRHLRVLGFDIQAWVQLLGGLVVGLIALYSSYDHITFGSHRFSLNQQWGVVCILASLAVVVIDAQLATRSRRREEDRRVEDALTAAEGRDRAARREAAQLQRSRVEAEASRAQLAYSVDPSTAQRAQLEQALIKLSSAEVQALYDDEVLERQVGLR